MVIPHSVWTTDVRMSQSRSPSAPRPRGRVAKRLQKQDEFGPSPNLQKVEVERSRCGFRRLMCDAGLCSHLDSRIGRYGTTYVARGGRGRQRKPLSHLLSQTTCARAKCLKFGALTFVLNLLTFVQAIESNASFIRGRASMQARVRTSNLNVRPIAPPRLTAVPRGRPKNSPRAALGHGALWHKT